MSWRTFFLLVMLLLSLSSTRGSRGRVMTELEKRMEEKKKQEERKKKVEEMRSTARKEKEGLYEELARAKQRHNERQALAREKKEKAQEEWSDLQQLREKQRKQKEGVPDHTEYEYVYIDEDGNYYSGNEDDDNDEEEDDDEEVEDEDITDEQLHQNNFAKKNMLLVRGYFRVYDDSDFFVLRRNELNDLLPIIQNKTSCLFRNVSHMNRLRDDHQMNLKEQREALKERRKEKREKKSQEILDEMVELDSLRAQMSLMTTAELQEQKDFKKNLTKALSRAEKVVKEREEEQHDIEMEIEDSLVAGARVLARYDRKPQFLIGRITNVRTDGSFDIRYDSGAEETRVDRALIVPVSGVEEKALNKKGGKSDKAMSGFDDLKEKALSSKERQKQNFLELYAKREAARQEEIQALQEVEKPSGRVVGSDCEAQVCGACKLIVDEFAHKVHANINNNDFRTLDDLFNYVQPFCSSPQIVNKFTKVVHMVCENMFTETKYREFFIREFESIGEWENVLNLETLISKKQRICKTNGLCSEDSFDYEREENDGWGSDECFVCHALMEDLEEKASLYKLIDQNNSPDIASRGCGDLMLEGNYAKECAKMVTGINLIETAWTLKLHYEDIQKRKVTFRSFPDVSCEKLSHCQRWIDPDVELTSVLDEIEHVYS